MFYCGYVFFNRRWNDFLNSGRLRCSRAWVERTFIHFMVSWMAVERVRSSESLKICSTMHRYEGCSAYTLQQSAFHLQIIN